MANAINARTTTDVSRPPFVVDHSSTIRDTGRQIDWDALDERYQYNSFAVVADGVSAQGATALTVEALERAIPAGTVLRFLGATEYARTTAAAAAGATSIDVEALVNAVEDGDIAYTGGSGGKFVPAGTVMDLLASGKIVPSAMASGGVTAYGVLVTNADEDSRTDALTGYGVFLGGLFYENLLPEASGSPAVIDSNWKTELLARGSAWQFLQYADNTV